MQAVNTSDDYVITAAATRDLELLASVYSLASSSPDLSNFARSAILRGIQAELDDRTAPLKSGFVFASEIERLQAALEAKEDKIFELNVEIGMLEDELEEAKKNGKSKPKS
jgi:hypothetical protein